MSLFSATQNKPSLFGGAFGSNNQQQQQSSGSLFGLSQQGQQTNTTNPFGQPSQQAQQPSTSLFGQTQQQQQPPSNPFGQPQQQQSSLFGGQQNQASQGTSLFGNNNSQPQQSGGLFGANQQQQQHPSNSLFGAPQQQQNTNLYSTSQNQFQQSSRSVWQPGQMPQPREKTIPEQMQTIHDKWSPESSTCVFQTYFYNTVRPEAVPYYGPSAGEDETKWEEALARKPDEDAIPVLCKGFAALGNRLRIEVQSLTSLQARLHEVNGSLQAILQQHDIDISVRANDAKRRHVTLAQRTLQLATKIQTLRNRGYALDGAEEGLRKRLLTLERSAFDPRLNGRQEEIWARMVGLREKARFLQEEAEKAGRNFAENNGEAIDQEVLKKTKKILGDYDSQIAHLTREMNTIRKDFEDWEKGPDEHLAGRR